MPIATRKICLSRSPRKLGFSLRSSCKAQGFIARSSGKKFKSPKYTKTRKNRRSKK